MSQTSVAPNDCPEPPGFKARLSTLIVHEACQTLGGIAQLAERLRVTTRRLQRWLDGADEVPHDVYQACIDIVLLHEDEDHATRVKPKIHTK